jgi:hypothetical protein
MNINKHLAKLIERILPYSTIAILCAFFLWYIFSRNTYNDVISKITDKFLTEANISSIITVSAVFIGFFSTIMTIFATCQTSAMKRVIQTKKVKSFLLFSKIALLVSILIMIFSLLLPVVKEVILIASLYYVCLFYFIAVSLRFTYVCVNMLSYTVEEYEQQIIAERKKKVAERHMQKQTQS